MFAPWVIANGITETPVYLAFPNLALDQRMAKFVQYHLSDRIIGVEQLIGCNQNSATTVGGGIGI